MATIFDQIYKEESYAYGTIPNLYFKEKLDALSPGKILLPAEGEGRNAVYAASQGWDVYCFDNNQYGYYKALKLAKEKQVDINYELKTAQEIQYDLSSFDVLALIYTPLEHSDLIKYLKPQGHLIFENFSKNQIQFHQVNAFSGGPRDASLLYDYSLMQDAFKTLKAKESYETEIVLNEGIYHNGLSSVLRFYGVK
ncbi:SAM-dependent methyltransferase [Myroides marinus]|uniref:class I SAM-dependent methyltransferase n=1 Tax=Myroides marinus TaxID=703342 RepID=UPI002574CB47|nr:methyltransferase domain-containing protein [Myroides marinus]MDM1352466.1 SAM-dependent methyltransferase [Myroides marinus]MDM1359673.1 SAM-dependent methyltransferase [Myroides marinus]